MRQKTLTIALFAVVSLLLIFVPSYRENFGTKDFLYIILFLVVLLMATGLKNNETEINRLRRRIETMKYHKKQAVFAERIIDYDVINYKSKDQEIKSCLSIRFDCKQSDFNPWDVKFYYDYYKMVIDTKDSSAPIVWQNMTTGAFIIGHQAKILTNFWDHWHKRTSNNPQSKNSYAS